MMVLRMEGEWYCRFVPQDFWQDRKRISDTMESVLNRTFISQGGGSKIRFFQVGGGPGFEPRYRLFFTRTVLFRSSVLTSYLVMKTLLQTYRCVYDSMADASIICCWQVAEQQKVINEYAQEVAAVRQSIEVLLAQNEVEPSTSHHSCGNQNRV